MSIQVMIIDDSALARNILGRAMEADPSIEVIGVAGSVEVAWTRVQRLKPQVILLDLRLGRDDGMTLLRQVMSEMPTPIIVVSALGRRGSRESVAALTAGAVFVVEKPNGRDSQELQTMTGDLRTKVKQAAGVRVRGITNQAERPSRPEPIVAATTEGVGRTSARAGLDLIAIGTSTGGAAALARILPTFPSNCPPVVVVDHMPAGYTDALARRLDADCVVTVREARDNEPLRCGEVLIAPGGDRHLHVTRARNELRVCLHSGPQTDGHCPSVTELFTSVAKNVGRTAAAALLTGMGRDGATGLLAIRKAGGFTITQDELSSVVYGMPKAAYELGASIEQVALDKIPARLLNGHAART